MTRLSLLPDGTSPTSGAKERGKPGTECEKARNVHGASAMCSLSAHGDVLRPPGALAGKPPPDVASRFPDWSMMFLRNAWAVTGPDGFVPLSYSFPALASPQRVPNSQASIQSAEQSCISPPLHKSRKWSLVVTGRGFRGTCRQSCRCLHDAVIVSKERRFRSNGEETFSHHPP